MKLLLFGIILQCMIVRNGRDPKMTLTALEYYNTSRLEQVCFWDFIVSNSCIACSATNINAMDPENKV